MPALKVRMTIEDIDGVNATLLWINLKSGILPAGTELQREQTAAKARGLLVKP